MDMVKLTRHILTVAVLASLAYAQTSATKPATTAAKPAPATSTKQAATLAAKAPAKTATKTAPASKPAPKSTATKPAATKAAPAKPPTKPATKAAPMKETKPKAEKPAAAKSAVVSKKYAARRDPFINPIKMRNEAMATTAACTTGAKCLMVDQVVLKGVVKTQQGMIAMVENTAKKQYNLHEKDAVYNGFVLKITGDSIVFKENITDNSGKPTTREVVKRVTVPVV